MSASLMVKVRNIERLISRCEDALGRNSKLKLHSWRTSKYAQSLKEKIQDLEKCHGDKVDSDQLRSFRQRLVVVQEVLHQQGSGQRPDGDGTSSPGPPIPEHVTPIQRPLDSTHLKGSGLLRRNVAQTEQDMREELFGKTEFFDSANTNSKDRNSGIESVLQRHQEIQEQLAEDMISIAKTLRTRSEAARSIIRNDQQVLKDASKVADQNIEGINRATGELKEKSRGCDWFTWITLTVVFIVFLQMILFIRLVSK